MSVQGVLVTCGFVSAANNDALIGSMSWSEVVAAGGTTVKSAPSQIGVNAYPAPAYPSFEVYSPFDCLVAIGKTPDPVNGARVFVRTGETRRFFCQPGDRVACAAA